MVILNKGVIILFALGCGSDVPWCLGSCLDFSSVVDQNLELGAEQSPSSYVACYQITFYYSKKNEAKIYACPIMAVSANYPCQVSLKS